jgi:Xaa-Pro aminopeptidase
MVGIFNDLLGTDFEPVYEPPRPGDVKHSLADITAARDLLGYEPQVGFRDGLAKTLEFMKPGVTAEQVEAAWRAAIAHSKVVKESRLGYSIGVNYTPDWGEQTISFRPGDTTVLEENMVLHLIPGIWYKEVGFEVDATVRVTANGVESLYDYPLKLFLK